MRPTTKFILSSLAFVLVAGCSGLTSAAQPNANQTWEFSLLDGTGGIVATSTGSCLQGGACGPFDWTVLNTQSFGCTLVYRFQVQFSGDQVRVLQGQLGPGTTCSGMSMGQNFGTGQANAAYPAATQASGTVTITWSSPIGPGGGPGSWQARKVS